jgi:hypothetical protein
LAAVTLHVVPTAADVDKVVPEMEKSAHGSDHDSAPVPEPPDTANSTDPPRPISPEFVIVNAA